MRERNILIQVLLNQKEADRLNRLVERSGLNRSSYLRQLISGVVPCDKPPPNYFLMMRELHSIGNNLNQIAKSIHVTGVIDEGKYFKNVYKLDEVIVGITESVILPKKYG